MQESMRAQQPDVVACSRTADTAVDQSSECWAAQAVECTRDKRCIEYLKNEQEVDCFCLIAAHGTVADIAGYGFASAGKGKGRVA